MPIPSATQPIYPHAGGLSAFVSLCVCLWVCRLQIFFKYFHRWAATISFIIWLVFVPWVNNYFINKYLNVCSAPICGHSDHRTLHSIKNTFCGHSLSHSARETGRQRGRGRQLYIGDTPDQDLQGFRLYMYIHSWAALSSQLPIDKCRTQFKYVTQLLSASLWVASNESKT